MVCIYMFFFLAMNTVCVCVCDRDSGRRRSSVRSNVLCCTFEVDLLLSRIFPKLFAKFEKFAKQFKKAFYYDTPLTISVLLLRESLEILFQSFVSFISFFFYMYVLLFECCF